MSKKLEGVKKKGISKCWVEDWKTSPEECMVLTCPGTGSQPPSAGTRVGMKDGASLSLECIWH